MHTPVSPRPRTYLQRHGVKIIGVILVLGFLNALQPFENYVIALWEYGQEVWQRYQAGEEAIEERARKRAKAQALLAIADQYSHPAMKELEQAFIRLGDSRGSRLHGMFPDLDPYRNFRPDGYSRSWVKHGKTPSESYVHCSLTRLMSANGSSVEELNFKIYNYDEKPSSTQQSCSHHLLVSIQGHGEFYQESLSWQFPYKVKIFGDWSEFKWELNRSELHIRNGTKFDDNFIDSSFVAGVRIDNSAKILNSLAVDETPSREVFHKILNLSCKIALDTVESERLDSFSREYDADDGETDGYFYYSNPFRITGLKPEKQKMVHKSTLKAVSDIKQILQESWPCVHSDLKDLLQAIEEPRRKLMETTPESP